MRRFRAAALLMAVVLAGALMLGGCIGRGSRPAGGEPGGFGQQPGQVLPEPEVDRQEITLALGGEPPGLDPALVTDTQSFLVLQNVMEGLVRLGEGGRVEQGSGQAESWTVSADGTEYTFRLRAGLQWSDGKPVTAGDFAHAWLRALDPQTESPYAYQLFYIKGARDFNSLPSDSPNYAQAYELRRAEVGIAAPDDRTLQVTLEGPTPYFLSLLAFPTYLPVRADVAAAHGDRFGLDADTLVFNGPFRIASWDQDREMVLERNPTYWDAGAVRLEQVRLVMIRDVNTALNMYEAGELDQVDLPGEFLDAYRDRGLQRMALGSTYYLALNARHPVLQNARVRQALGMAIDRTRYVEEVTHNGALVAEGLVPPGIAGAGDQPFRAVAGPVLPPGANAEHARTLLAEGMAELGLDEFPRLTLLTSESPTAATFNAGLRGMWAEVLGIQIDLEPVDFTVRLRRAHEGRFDLLSTGWIGDYNDPMTFLDMWTTGNPFNDAGWSNLEYDGHVARARQAADPQERAEALAAAERLLLEAAPVIPLYHGTANWLQHDWLHGVRRFAVGAELDLKFAYVEGRVR